MRTNNLLNLEAPQPLPIPNNNILQTAGVQNLNSGVNITSAARHIKDRLNNHPFLRTENGDQCANFNAVYNSHLSSNTNAQDQRYATELMRNILALLDKFQQDNDLTARQKEKLLFIFQANNEWACLPGCIAKLTNMLVGAQNIKHEGLMPLLFEAKRKTIEDILLKIASGTGQAESNLRNTIGINNEAGMQIHYVTGMGNAISDWTKIPRKNGDQYAQGTEGRLAGANNQRKNDLTAYIERKLAQKETAASLVSSIMDGLLPPMPMRSLNLTAEGPDRVLFNDVTAEIGQLAGNLGIEIDIDDLVIDPNNFAAFKFRPNADAILRRLIVEQLRVHDYLSVDLEYEDMVEVPQVQNFIRQADQQGINLRGNYESLEAIIVAAKEGLNAPTVNRQVCLTMLDSLKNLKASLQDIAGYQGFEEAQIQVRRGAERTINKTIAEMKDVCATKELGAVEGAIGPDNMIYKLFCNNSPRVVATYLYDLKKAAAPGGMGNHEFFISPHALLDKCPPKLISRMGQVAEILTRMERGVAHNETGLRLNILDYLAVLVNYFKMIGEQIGICSSVRDDKLAIAMRELNDISRPYNQPNLAQEVPAKTTISFVEKLRSQSQRVEIGAYAGVNA